MQVERSRSFLDHLICIQQEQRAVLYSFAKQLELFRQHLGHLTNLSTVPITSDQLVTLKFMRQQKVSSLWTKLRFLSMFHISWQLM